MFEKLNIVLSDLDIHRLKDNGAQLWADYMPEFREYKIRDLNYCQSLFRFNLGWDHANITVIESGGAKIPHTDAWSVALNYYIDAGQEITTFYDNPTNHRITCTDTPGLDTYDPDQLIPAATFCAVSGDCYLLNTQVPHDVTDRHAGSRTILRLIWYHESYQSVLDKIRRSYEW